MRHLLTWWWVIAICAVLVPALVVSLAGNRLTSATAKVRVHEVDTSVAYLSSGEPQPYTGSRSVNELTKSDFIDPQVAADAAPKAGGLTGQDIVNGLGFTPLNGTDVEFSYSGGSTAAVAAKRLGAYVDTFVSERRAAQRGPLIAAAKKLRANGASSSAAQRLLAAAESLDQQIYQVGQITSSKGRIIPTSAVVAGSLLAGITLGILVALAMGALDPRVRRLADLRSAGLRAIEVESSDHSSVETLRAIVELAGVGPSGGVIAVTTPVGRHETLVAQTLASAFADTGRPTTLLTDRGPTRWQDGEWVLVPGEGHLLQTTTRLRDALSAGRPGEVTVIEATGFEQRPDALIASAVSDVTLLCLQRGTTWSQLERSLELLEDSVVAGRVRVTFERGGLLTRGRSSMLGRAAKPRRTQIASHS
jgi:hypothetical protein